MEQNKVTSPCISVCKTDPISGYCYGCGRTNEEKDIWKDENTSIENTEVLDETEMEIEITVQDFLGIENYIQKDISSLISTYGNFNFSKKEKIYELHRYNANKCRIFIQNNTSNKKIISITIFHIEEKKVLKNYKKDLCN